MPELAMKSTRLWPLWFVLSRSRQHPFGPASASTLPNPFHFLPNSHALYPNFRFSELVPLTYDYRNVIHPPAARNLKSAVRFSKAAVICTNNLEDGFKMPGKMSRTMAFPEPGAPKF